MKSSKEDSDRLDWLEAQSTEVFEDIRGHINNADEPCTVRQAIDFFRWRHATGEWP